MEEKDDFFFPHELIIFCLNEVSPFKCGTHLLNITIRAKEKGFTFFHHMPKTQNMEIYNFHNICRKTKYGKMENYQFSFFVNLWKYFKNIS